MQAHTINARELRKHHIAGASQGQQGTVADNQAQGIC
jgi:hypothetical protein